MIFFLKNCLCSFYYFVGGFADYLNTLLKLWVSMLRSFRDSIKSLGGIYKFEKHFYLMFLHKIQWYKMTSIASHKSTWTYLRSTFHYFWNLERKASFDFTFNWIFDPGFRNIIAQAHKIICVRIWNKKIPTIWEVHEQIGTKIRKWGSKVGNLCRVLIPVFYY